VSARKGKWELDHAKGKVNSINGKDGRLFTYNFQRDYIDLQDGDWQLRLDYGFTEWHIAPRSDEWDKTYEAKFEGAFTNDKGVEYPFSFEGEFWHSHHGDGDEDDTWSFHVENKDKLPPFWDEVDSLLHEYIMSM